MDYDAILAGVTVGVMNIITCNITYYTLVASYLVYFLCILMNFFHVLTSNREMATHTLVPLHT